MKKAFFRLIIVLLIWFIISIIDVDVCNMNINDNPIMTHNWNMFVMCVK